MKRELDFLRGLGLGEVAERPPLHHREVPDHAFQHVDYKHAPYERHAAFWGLDRTPVVLRRPVPFDNGTDLLAEVRERQALLVLHDGRAQVSYLRRIDDEAQGRTAFTQYRPGCWVGVAELVLAAVESGALPATDEAKAQLARVLEAWPERRVVALGRIDFISPTQAHIISFEPLLDALRQEEGLRRWLGDQFACQYLLRGTILKWVDRHPLLRNFSQSDREYLLQLGSLAQAQRWTEGPCPVYQHHGRRPDRAALLLSGDARLYAPEQNGATGFVARLGPGSLLGDEALVQTEDLESVKADQNRSPQPRNGVVPEPRPTEIRLAPDSTLIEFDWASLRRTLDDSWEHFLPAVRYIRRTGERISPEQARVVICGGSLGGAEVVHLARGLAYALAAGRWGEVPSEPLAGEVWLVETSSSDEFVEWPHDSVGWNPVEVDGLAVWFPASQSAYGRGPKLPQGPAQFADFQRPLAKAPLVNRASDYGLRVVRAGSDVEVERLVSVLRGRADTRFVVVASTEPTGPFIGVDQTAERAPLEQWMSTEDVTLLWMHDDPAAPFPKGFEFSSQVVQVDRVNAAYRERARALSKRPGWKWLRGHATDGTRAPVNGTVRILDCAEGETLLEQGDWQAVVNGTTLRGRALRRLARAVTGRTIGLALGGGGVWGSAHFAVIEALLGGPKGVDPFPIDYVSGTSFGALVGGLFAGGGLAAAQKFVDREFVREGSWRTLRGMAHSRMFKSTVVNSAFSTRPLERMIDDVLEDGLLDPADNALLCTEIPFYPVSTMVDRHRSFATAHGSIGFGVRAAGSLPPVGPAMRRGRNLVTDGAFVENVPAEMVRNRGADFVICANVIGPPASPFSEWVARVPPLALAFDATVGRMLTLYRGNMLSQWMIGESQGRLKADLRLDLRTATIPLYAGWMAKDLWHQFRAQLAAEKFRERVGELYGRHLEVRHRERMLVELA